jgi:hypothetical protein
MQKKKLRLAVAREIRRVTGIGLPVSVALAKASVRVATPTMTVAEIAAVAPRAFIVQSHAAEKYELPAGVILGSRSRGCECGCTVAQYFVCGPKGEIVAES